MKDLYKQLGIHPHSDIEAVRKRLRDNPGTANPATVEAILLNPNRKRVYDRAHTTATRIGLLEANLKLPIEDSTSEFRPAYPNTPSELALFARPTSQPKQQSNSCTIGCLVLLGLLGLFAVVSSITSVSNYSQTQSQTTVSNSTPMVATPTPFNHPLVAFPNNGAYVTYTNKAMGAPLKITTEPQEPGDYYCKLINATTGRTEMVLFVRGGMTAEFQVPLGRYKLKYAYGYPWYGPKYLFGPSTICVKADELIQFSIVGDQYQGHSIELYKRPNGNFETENIPMSEF